MVRGNIMVATETFVETFLETFCSLLNEDKVEVIELLVKNQGFVSAFEDYGLSKLMDEADDDEIVSAEEGLRQIKEMISEK